ncbi:MAG TPA: hypothetical protein VKD90_15350 [Gemmataceae bacterium]|nr:hypothetical protein [Gemmataceae bacterium]
MPLWAWVVVLFVYFLVGCLLLLRLSDRDRGLAPTPDWMGVIWILMWPLVLGVWAVFRLPGPPTAPEKPGGFQPGRLPPGRGRGQ